MTNEQINIAIAGACGWMYAPDDLPDYPWQNEQGEAHRSHPDYSGCLNAMHGAEKALNPIKAAEYARMLTSIAWQSEQPVFAPMTATARQRAEAFLRIIGKWEEEA